MVVGRWRWAYIHEYDTWKKECAVKNGCFGKWFQLRSCWLLNGALEEGRKLVLIILNWAPITSRVLQKKHRLPSFHVTMSTGLPFWEWLCIAGKEWAAALNVAHRRPCDTQDVGEGCNHLKQLHKGGFPNTYFTGPQSLSSKTVRITVV